MANHDDLKDYDYEELKQIEKFSHLIQQEFIYRGSEGDDWDNCFELAKEKFKDRHYRHMRVRDYVDMMFTNQYGEYMGDEPRIPLPDEFKPPTNFNPEELKRGWY